MFMANRNSNTRFTVKTYNTQEREATTRRISSYLRGLASRRTDGVVTADDVHTYLNREGVRPQQVRTRLSFINSVFSNGMFAQDGMVASARPQAKGRYISAWTLA
jgi:hypothetical protein